MSRLLLAIKDEASAESGKLAGKRSESHAYSSRLVCADSTSLSVLGVLGTRVSTLTLRSSPTLRSLAKSCSRSDSHAAAGCANTGRGQRT